MVVIKDWRRRQANFKVTRNQVAKTFEHEADVIRSGFRQRTPTRVNVEAEHS